MKKKTTEGRLELTVIVDAAVKELMENSSTFHDEDEPPPNYHTNPGTDIRHDGSVCSFCILFEKQSTLQSWAASEPTKHSKRPSSVRHNDPANRLSGI